MLRVKPTTYLCQDLKFTAKLPEFVRISVVLLAKLRLEYAGNDDWLKLKFLDIWSVVPESPGAWIGNGKIKMASHQVCSRNSLYFCENSWERENYKVEFRIKKAPTFLGSVQFSVDFDWLIDIFRP